MVNLPDYYRGYTQLGTRPNINFHLPGPAIRPAAMPGNAAGNLIIHEAGYLSGIAGDPFRIRVGHRQKPVPTFPDHALEDTRILWSI
jgi:hypothetical protein